MTARRGLGPQILKACIVITALFAHSSCYLLNQGASLLRYQVAAEPIDTILEHGVYADGTAVSAQTREFLAEVGFNVESDIDSREMERRYGIAGKDQKPGRIMECLRFLDAVVPQPG